MTDSLVETKAPTGTSALPAIGRGVGPGRRNFFPFHILWFSIIALEISFLSIPRIAESDLWFHLRNAQELLSTQSLPHADSYTFTTAGAPLLNHEWLSELPYYFAFHAWGLRGVLAVYLLVLSLVFSRPIRSSEFVCRTCETPDCNQGRPKTNSVFLIWTTANRQYHGYGRRTEDLLTCYKLRERPQPS